MALDIKDSNIFNAPTNPYLIDTSPTDGHRIYTAITTEDTSVAITGWGGTITENSNLNTTKGFRIKCYDSLTTTGIRFNPTATNLTDNDFFVLIYSDKPYQHHFAKITEVLTEDEYGDAFEFEPKLGNEIPKDTKFIIFQMTKNGSVVAVSMGMLQDDSLGSASNDFEGELWRRMAVARPLFYFPARESNLDGMDKSNELNHNRKFYAMRESGTANSYTLSNADNCQVFTTMQDFGKSVVDYSRFSYKIKLTDKLRDLDAAQVASPSTSATNEGTIVSADDTDYNDSHFNARRIADDVITSPVFTGPLRYLSYDFSPTKSNLLYNVYDHNNTESIDGKGGFAETSVIDNGRIMPRKVKEFDAYRVRHTIHTGDMNEFFALKTTYNSSTSATVFSFNTEYDLGTVLNTGDEVKIDDEILIVKTIGSLSGTTQALTFENDTSNPYARTESEGEFTAQSITPSSGATLHRRAYNAKDGTLMLDTTLLNGRFSKMYLSFTSLNHNERFATITACDATKGMITLLFSDASYNTNPLSFAQGEYRLHIERFNGEIENIQSKKEDGQTIMEIQGRDKFNKLLSPVVNLNSLFSEDIIYSTNSPYNKLGNVRSASTFTITLGQETWQTTIPCDSSNTGPNFDNFPIVGTKLFTANGYVGEVLTSSLYSHGGGAARQYTITPALTEANSEAIYMDIEKNYVLSKALGSSHLATNKPSSLTGAANKGLIFTSGNKITMSSGAESDSLVSSSANASAGAIGYAINKPSSISNDFAFQALLKDEHGSAGSSSFDTVNTLIDFEVVSTSKKDNITQIELAPYIPITLGRKTNYFTDTSEMTFTEVGTITAFSNINDRYFETTNTNAYSLLLGEPLFVGTSKTFVGLVFDIVHLTTTAAANTRIALDRTIVDLSTGNTIYKAAKPTNDLVLVNGSHLWGGKILTSPHLKFLNSQIVPLNIESTTIAGDNSSRFGQAYYKTHGVSFGNFGLNKPLVFDLGKKIPNLYANKSNFNYYASAYNFKPNTGSSNINNTDKTDSSYRVLPPHQRGLTSPYGSNLNNVRIHTDGIETKMQNQFTNEMQIQARYTDIDESNARLFLYINSDILPYTALREDSLLHETSNAITKNILNYNLFLLENNKTKDSSIESGNRLLLNDNSFQTIGFSTEEDISQLKRFGLMRLTELCVDFMFNPVNPEKRIKKKYENIFSREFKTYAITSVGTINTISGAAMAFTGSVSLTDGDYLVDENGLFLGIVDTTQTAASHAFKSNVILTNNGSKATSAFKVVSTDNNIKGRGNKDSFSELASNELHPLKCCIIPEGSTYGGDSGDKANGISLVSNQEITLPLAFTSDLMGLSADVSSDFRPFTHLITHDYGKAHSGLIGVVLDRFDIEDGGESKAESGNTTQVLKGVAGGINFNSMFHAALSSDKHFKSFDYPSDTSEGFTTARPYEVDGAYMAFKPRLWVDSGNYSTATITSSSGNLHKNVIDVETSSLDNNFLKFIDLTGCYLVPEEGVDIDGTSITKGTEFLSKSMNGATPSTSGTPKLIHIYSHEISNSNDKDHHLICDEALVNDTPYRILQPNQTCLYDFMPEKIFLNTLSSEYTKMANENKVYDMENHYHYKESKDISGNTNYRDDAVLSMFVAIDLNNKSSDGNVIIKSPNNFVNNLLPAGDYNMLFSDGENSEKISIRADKDDQTSGINLGSLTLSKGFNGQGIVSISETFTLLSNEELKINPTRACIGSTVSVGLEGEDLINELLEQEGIEFTTTSTDTPMYLAPNYQGVDLYSAIRYILDRKDMKLVEENDVFKIIPEDEDSLRTNITIDDSDEFLIIDFDKVSTLFDFFNEINVYGNAHKAVRKDIRSIQKRGRKTLEVVDNTLLTQEEVDKRATKLLRIHSRLNQKLSFTLHSRGIAQVRVGDIVNVSIPRENIEMNEYIVLEMEHQLTGFIKLQLGRYSKDLSDVFSELLISSKETKAALRSNDLSTQEVSFNFLDTVDTKEIKLLVRKRSAGGAGRTLGFGTALGFTTPLGFTGGAITITDLVEEDLA